MSTDNLKFSRTKDLDFKTTLNQRINEYFKSTNRSKYGNGNMVIKTVLLLTLYFAPYVVMLTGVVESALIYWLLWLVMGLGMAGIGMGIMHDANHGSYSRKKWVNTIMSYSLNFLGSNTEVWRLQHNYLHHNFTNIEGADDDINSPGLLRFSPNQERKKIHRFQFLYAWFFYGLFTLSRLFFQEFEQARRYFKTGLIKTKKEYHALLIKLISWKLFYLSYVLLVPMLLSPFSWGFSILCFVSMHYLAGLLLSIVFQTAHIMPECEFVIAEEDGEIENNWMVHEILTTTNYAPSSKIFSWLIGGLNYQIEHHLFPGICHVHYRKISKIVAETTKEFSIPYTVQKNFLQAVSSHVKMLYVLGKGATPVHGTKG